MESFQLIRRRTTELFQSLEQTLDNALPSSPRSGHTAPQVPTKKATWEKLHLPPLPRSSHTADVVSGTLYIFGGEVEPRKPVDNDMLAIVLPASGADADYYRIKAKPAEAVEAEGEQQAKAAEPVKPAEQPAKPAAAAKPAKKPAPANDDDDDDDDEEETSSDEDSDDDDEEEDSSEDDSDDSDDSDSDSDSSDDEQPKKKPTPASAAKVDKGKAPAAPPPLPNIPPPRVGHASAVIGHRIFIFGGRGGPDMAALNERGRVWVFDTRTHLWSYLDPRHAAAGPAPFSTPPPYPAPRSYHAAVATPKPDAPIAKPPAEGEVKRPSTATEAWGDWALGRDREKEATFGTPHNPLVGVLAERAVDVEDQGYGTFIIHGGCLSDGTRASDVWAFDVRSRVWQRLPDAPGPARGGVCLALSHRSAGGRLYRFGGYDGTAQQGGQLDILPLGLDVFDDQVSKGDAVLSVRGGWKTILFGKEDVGYKDPDPATKPPLDAPETAAALFPGNRSVASMEIVTLGGGKEYLVLMFGERESSGAGHAKAGKFWDDIWVLPLQAEGGLFSSLAGKAAGAVGAISAAVTGGGTRSRSASKASLTSLYSSSEETVNWIRVETAPHDEEDDASLEGPGPRGWVASSPLRELEENAIVVFGGLNENNRRLGDAWILRLE